MILICYDGSPDSQAAIAQCGELFSGDPATVLTVWEPYIDMMTRTGAGMGYWAPVDDIEKIDAASERAAGDRAEEGCERAHAAGLNPQPRARARATTIAATILSEAEDVDAGAIVLGTRGLTGLKSMFLGSVSHAVLQHADRPVVVVPSAEVAAARAAGRH